MFKYIYRDKLLFIEKMEAIVSDDSCDSEMKIMKDQLQDFGLDDENLTKDEMSDLLKALNDSKTSAREDELLRQKADDVAVESPNPKQKMKRRYLAVRDRRLPWCLLPNDITPAQKARTLAVYIKLMAINRYRQARQATNFAVWPPPIQITEECNTRVQPLRSTRSGRLVPMYTDYDDDSTDMDFVVAKTKRRKISGTDVDLIDGGGIYTNKVMSLKRKPLRDDYDRNEKDVKIINDFNKYEPSTSDYRKVIKRDFIVADEEN